jgi:hypothetical protein
LAAVQYTFTHKQYTECRERNTHNNKKNEKCVACPVFASYTLAFALQLRKRHGKSAVRVVEKCSGSSQKVEICYKVFVAIIISKRNNSNMRLIINFDITQRLVLKYKTVI